MFAMATPCHSLLLESWGLGSECGTCLPAVSWQFEICSYRKFSLLFGISRRDVHKIDNDGMELNTEPSCEHHEVTFLRPVTFIAPPSGQLVLEDQVAVLGEEKLLLVVVLVVGQEVDGPSLLIWSSAMSVGSGRGRGQRRKGSLERTVTTHLFGILEDTSFVLPSIL